MFEEVAPGKGHFRVFSLIEKKAGNFNRGQVFLALEEGLPLPTDWK
jgi:hypothetical protein